MAWGACAKGAILLTIFCYTGVVSASVIALGVKIQVSKVRIEKGQTFFKHKNTQFVYSGTLKVIDQTDKAAEIFLTFDQLKKLLHENNISLGGVAGGGGGK